MRKERLAKANHFITFLDFQMNSNCFKWSSKVREFKWERTHWEPYFCILFYNYSLFYLYVVETIKKERCFNKLSNNKLFWIKPKAISFVSGGDATCFHVFPENWVRGDPHSWFTTRKGSLRDIQNINTYVQKFPLFRIK